jgi:hypothetical protein
LKEVDLMMYVGGDFFNFSFSLHPQMKKWIFSTVDTQQFKQTQNDNIV